MTVENSQARELAMELISSKKARCVLWLVHLSGAPRNETGRGIESCRCRIPAQVVVKVISSSQELVRYNMNGFEIAAETYAKPLLVQAKATAQEIGAVSVNMGDTACKVPLASASIAKIEASGSVGQKRKTIRCEPEARSTFCASEAALSPRRLRMRAGQQCPSLTRSLGS